MNVPAIVIDVGLLIAAMVEVPPVMFADSRVWPIVNVRSAFTLRFVSVAPPAVAVPETEPSDAKSPDW
jgi:hypothetical protein